MFARLLPPVLAAALLVGCAERIPGFLTTGGADMRGYAGGNLSSLISGSVITEAEQELRDIQTRDTEMRFPVKIGLLNLQYNSSLKAEDQQAAFDDAKAKLIASGHVKDVFKIPENVTTGADSLDNLRKMAARFQADVLFIVSGSSSFSSDRVDAGFFDLFTNRTALQARTSLSGIGLDVFAGVFMTPVQAATVAGPLEVDANASDYTQSRYKLYKEAEMAALQKLQENLATALAAKRKALEASTTK